jgi:hypothetical protein
MWLSSVTSCRPVTRDHWCLSLRVTAYLPVLCVLAAGVDEAAVMLKGRCDPKHFVSLVHAQRGGRDVPVGCSLRQMVHWKHDSSNAVGVVAKAVLLGRVAALEEELERRRQRDAASAEREQQLAAMMLVWQESLQQLHQPLAQSDGEGDGSLGQEETPRNRPAAATAAAGAAAATAVSQQARGAAAAAGCSSGRELMKKLPSSTPAAAAGAKAAAPGVKQPQATAAAAGDKHAAPNTLQHGSAGAAATAAAAAAAGGASGPSVKARPAGGSVVVIAGDRSLARSAAAAAEETEPQDFKALGELLLGTHTPPPLHSVTAWWSAIGCCCAAFAHVQAKGCTSLHMHTKDACASFCCKRAFRPAVVHIQSSHFAKLSTSCLAARL